MKKHILYNTNTETIEGRPYNGRYIDKYTQGKLNNGIIELEVIDVPAPHFDPTTHRAKQLEWEIDTFAETHTRQWEIVPLTEYELAVREWKHTEYEKRITAPKMLTIQFAGVLKWFEIENLPFHSDENFIYLWCRFIRPEHQGLIDIANSQLEGTGLSIVIGDRPEILSNETPT
jgi:hypothetical protein